MIQPLSFPVQVAAVTNIIPVVVNQQNLACVYINDLHPGTLNSDLAEYFSRFGDIVYSTGNKNKFGTLLNYAYICYQSMDSVERLMDSRPHTIDGNQLEIRRVAKYSAKLIHKHEKLTRKVFIEFELMQDNFAENRCWSLVTNYFSKFGEVNSVQMDLVNRCASITFADYDSVDKILLKNQYHQIDQADFLTVCVSRDFSSELPACEEPKITPTVGVTRKSTRIVKNRIK